MKVAYVVTFDAPLTRDPTPAELDHVRALLYATEDSTHVTVTALTGKPPHPFPTP